MTLKFDYIKDPDTIYQQSFDLVQADIDMSDFPPDLHHVIIRMVHACANPHILPQIAYTKTIVQSLHRALHNKAPILCDVQMVASGICTRLLNRDKNPVICTLNHPKTSVLAKHLNITRSAAGVELWHPYIKDSIVIIGNAPTALFYLLEKIYNENWDKPACIIGLPIGYVGAVQSKQALIQHAGHIDYITLCGRMGGSAMACAVFNAILGCNTEKYTEK